MTKGPVFPFLVGVGVAVGALALLRAIKSFDASNPAPLAGRRFYADALSKGYRVSLHSMRTVREDRRRPSFDAWATSVKDPDAELRSMAEAAAKAFGVRLLTYTGQDGLDETYVFVC